MTVNVTSLIIGHSRSPTRFLQAAVLNIAIPTQPTTAFGDLPAGQLLGAPKRIAAARYAASCPENDRPVRITSASQNSLHAPRWENDRRNHERLGRRHEADRARMADTEPVAIFVQFDLKRQ